MKKITALAIGFVSIIASTFSYADFQLKTFDGSCAQLAGKWNGKGHASNWMVDCNYHGIAIITMADETHFFFDVNVDKDSGSFVCPSHKEERLLGSCKNGNIDILTNYGTLTGSVGQNQAHASGRLNLLPGIGADVEIEISRG